MKKATRFGYVHGITNSDDTQAESRREKVTKLFSACVLNYFDREKNRANSVSGKKRADQKASPNLNGNVHGIITDLKSEL